MITVIRRYIKLKQMQVILWVAGIALGILFVMPDVSNRMQGPEWVVNVNGRKVGYTTFARSVVKQESNIHTIQEQYGSYAQMFLQMLGLTKDPRITALDEVVRNELMDQVVKDIPLHIQEDYIEQALNVPHLAQQRGLFELFPLGIITQQGLDTQALQSYMVRSQLNMQQLEREVEQALARHIAYELAGLAAYVPEFMVHDAVDRELSIRDYTLLTFPRHALKKEVASEAISAPDLAAFFEKESKNYWVPEMRAGIVWKFTPEHYGITVSNEAIEDFYEKNRVKKYMDEPAQIQVRRILLKFSETEPKQLLTQRAAMIHDELVNNPKDFEAKALQYSDDNKTAAQGGLLPFFAKGEKDPAFERRAFTLKEDGDISSVFESAEGLEIIQRVAKKAPLFKSLSQAKQEIHDILLKQQFAQQFGKDMKRIIDRTGIDEAALATFVKEKKSVSTQLDAAAKDDSKRMQVMFKLKKGDADFYTEGNTGYIVQVTEVKKKYLPTLDTIQEAVQADYIDYKVQETLAQRMKDALRATSSPSEVARQYGASVQEVKAVDPTNQERIKQLQESGIPVGKMLQIEKLGAVGSHSADDGYIFYVSNVVKPQEALYNEKEMEKYGHLNNEARSLIMQGFVASLARNAKIETNESLFTQIENQAI